MGLSWQRGVAFVRGINVFGRRRISKREMLNICRGVEDENLRIVGIFRADNIVFEKRQIHYGNVSSRLEKVLSDYFKENVYVTFRSMRTIKLLARRGEG
jgi:uncharacterized protein (DUF1697 family)